MSTGFPSASDDWPLTTQTTGSTGCYASAASGYAAAAPFRRPRKPSRLMPAPGSGQGIVSSQTRPLEGPGSGCWDRPVGGRSRCPLWVKRGLAVEALCRLLSVVSPIGDKFLRRSERSEVPLATDAAQQTWGDSMGQFYH